LQSFWLIHIPCAAGVDDFAVLFAYYKDMQRGLTCLNSIFTRIIQDVWQPPPGSTASLNAVPASMKTTYNKFSLHKLNLPDAWLCLILFSIRIQAGIICGGAGSRRFVRATY